MPNTLAAILLACALALVGWSARHRPPRYGTRMHPQRVPPWMAHVPARRGRNRSIASSVLLTNTQPTSAVGIVQVGPTIMLQRVCGCADRIAQLHP